MLEPPPTVRLYGTSSAPFFFFNDTATTEIYTLSLHDALPISGGQKVLSGALLHELIRDFQPPISSCRDRKSTRLNSSHGYISYAVFCLKKKKTIWIASRDNC